MSFTIAFMSQLFTIYHFAMLKSSITFIVKQTVLIRNLLLESNTFTTCIYTYLHHYIYILMCPQSFQIRPKFCNIWSKKNQHCLRRRDWFISICDVQMYSFINFLVNGIPGKKKEFYLSFHFDDFSSVKISVLMSFFSWIAPSTLL